MGELVTIALLCVAAGALIWGLHWLSKRQEGWLSRPNPRRLFRELCKTHQLSRHDRQLLTQLAEASDIGQPSELFLRPDLFETDSLAAEMKNWGTDLARIAEILFKEQPATRDRSTPDATTIQPQQATQPEEITTA